METIQNFPEITKKDFPLLNKNLKSSEQIIYLDHAATTQKPIQVLEKINEYYRNFNANVHRGAHQLSAKATEEFENARYLISKYIKANSTKEIIFTRNATEAINLAARSWGESSLKENDILIEVYCCGISFADILAVEGKYQDTPPLPFTPGLEISGVILDIGSKVKNFRIGDEVIALSKWGGFADKVIINENFVVSKLKKMPFDLAACMTINYGTSYYALIERAKIKPKDKILILGASGGIGLSAIEICKAIGCEVTAMASSEDKLLACKEYGADNLVLTKKDNLRDSLKDFKEITFDIIYDLSLIHI